MNLEEMKELFPNGALIKYSLILEAMFAIAKVLNAPVQDLLTNEFN
ncbi:hypothetical protein [Prevotella pallens]